MGLLTAMKAVVPGVVKALRAAVVDENKDIGDFRNLDAVNIDAGSSGTAGSVDIFPATASKGKLAVTCANQTGNTTVTFNFEEMGQATNIGVPDPGGADADVILSLGDQTLGGTKTFSALPKTSYGVGAVVAGKATAVEYGIGNLHQTELTFTLTGANDIDLADGADHGTGVKVYDFPEGRILILGATINALVTSTNAEGGGGTFPMALGTEVGADDATLTSTEADIIPSTAVTGGAAQTFKAALAASAQFDGTGTAKDLYVNAAVTDAVSQGAVTIAVTGTALITWLQLGDY